MKPYSVDLRECVLAALDRGMSRGEAVSTFQISLASIKRWLAARRDSGDLRARPSTGGPGKTITIAHEPELRAQISAFPDATFAEHARRWNAAHQMSLSQWSIGRAVRRLGVTRKKSR
jgi:transposase